MGKFKRGDIVRKIKGSSWRGTVVGEYSTNLTPEGYAVESDSETGSVQIYPASALEPAEQLTPARMTDKKEHPHAWVLRAIADGEPLENFELKTHKWSDDEWRNASNGLTVLLLAPGEWQVRRKPRTIRIGDMDVPEPMREALTVGTPYWVTGFSGCPSFSSVWGGSDYEVRWLASGGCHLTYEAAELHRKALILVSGGTP